jgi:hypothetical protein
LRHYHIPDNLQMLANLPVYLLLIHRAYDHTLRKRTLS